VSGGHLCEAEAPTEATAETFAPPVANLNFNKRNTATIFSIVAVIFLNAYFVYKSELLFGKYCILGRLNIIENLFRLRRAD